MDSARARPAADFARAAIDFCDLPEWAPLDDTALAGLEAALAQLPEAADAERAHLLTRIAYLSARRDSVRAHREARRATELARRIGDPAVLQDAIYALHFLLAGPDHLDEREALGREAAESAAQATPRDATLVTVLDTGCDRLTRGDAEGARRQRALGAALAGPAHRTSHARGTSRSTTPGSRPSRVASTTPSDPSRRRPWSAAASSTRTREVSTARRPRCSRASAARRRASPRSSTRRCRSGRDQRNGCSASSRARSSRSVAATRRSGSTKISQPPVSKIPRNIRWPDTIVEAANLCADLGDAERAPSLRALLLPVAELHGVLPMAICYGGPVSRCLARLAETLGERDEARQLHDEALAACARIGARPMQARLQIESGTLLLRVGEKQRLARPDRGRRRARGGTRHARRRRGRPRALGSGRGLNYSTMTSPAAFGCWRIFSFTVPLVSNLWVKSWSFASGGLWNEPSSAATVCPPGISSTLWKVTDSPFLIVTVAGVK